MFYRMSSPLAVEAVPQRLIGEPHQSPTRFLGYANRHILRVGHLAGHPPTQSSPKSTTPRDNSSAHQPSNIRPSPAPPTPNTASTPTVDGRHVDPQPALALRGGKSGAGQPWRFRRERTGLAVLACRVGAPVVVRSVTGAGGGSEDGGRRFVARSGAARPPGAPDGRALGIKEPGSAW
jgi:hypothetical protein